MRLESISLVHRRCTRRFRPAVLAAAIAALMPAFAAAQSLGESGKWRWGVSLYGYLPALSGKSSAPVDTGGTDITIDIDKLLDSLDFTVMGAVEAHNGRWGMFTDFMYLNLGAHKQQSRDFTIGNAQVPAGTTAELGYDFKGSIWTVAGEYRLVANPRLTLDALGGVRWFDVRTKTNWTITGDLGSAPPTARSGSVSKDTSGLDGIVGVRGRLALGDPGAWSMPFYLDIGAGESSFTWQAATGVSYAFKWGEAVALWRYLSYDMKSGKGLEDLSFSGPMLGLTWRF